MTPAVLGLVSVRQDYLYRIIWVPRKLGLYDANTYDTYLLYILLYVVAMQYSRIENITGTRLQTYQDRKLGEINRRCRLTVQFWLEGFYRHNSDSSYLSALNSYPQTINTAVVTAVCGLGRPWRLSLTAVHQGVEGKRAVNQHIWRKRLIPATRVGWILTQNTYQYGAYLVPGTYYTCMVQQQSVSRPVAASSAALHDIYVHYNYYF